MSNLFFHISL